MDPELIKRFFNNQCSRQEVIQVLEWISSLNSKNEFNQDFDANIDNIQPATNYDIDSLYERTKEKLNMEQLVASLKDDLEHEHNNIHSISQTTSEREKIPLWHKSLKIAAAVSLLILIGVSLYFISVNNVQYKDKNALQQMVVKETEKGQKLTTVLPDGSSVVMNYKTKLTFPEQFTDTLRVVELDGEAFFDIISNPDRPLVVRTGNLSIRVLGTSFAVESRVEDSTSTVSLVRGRVEVKRTDKGDKTDKPVIMSPGESIVYDPGTQTIQKLDYIPEEKLVWKAGIIQFNKASYREVMNELENWFDVEIITNGPSPSWKFTAKYENENLENILQGISDAQHIDYELSNKKVIIKTK